MDFGTVKGVVYIRGVFQISHASADGDEEKMKDLAIKTLYSFEKKVRSIPGVSDVIFQLLNWRKERGQWVPIEMIKKEEEEEDEEEDEKKTESHA
jgi:predicted RND superfamily exporter protein